MEETIANPETIKVENIFIKEPLNEEVQISPKNSRKRQKVDMVAIAEEKKRQLEIQRQSAFQKLQKLLQCSQKYSSFLIQELQRFQKTFEENETIEAIQNTNKENLADNMEATNEKLKAFETKSVGKHPKLFTGGQMRQYQIEGFEWLRLMYENGVSCILADEMGLGKTIQAIAFVAHLIENGITGPFLICAPLSTLPNWISEFKRFTPEIPVLLFHGDAATRKELAKKIVKMHSVGIYDSYPVVLTTYELPMIEKSLLSKYKWRTFVVDEGQRLKNVNSQLRTTLQRYHLEHKILLTGTPLQNNLTELWSLLNFLIPEIFNDLAVFESWFDIVSLAEKGGDEEIIAQEQERHIVSAMHEILTPFLLRRTKAKVNMWLPPKKEVLVYAHKSEKQEEFFRATLDRTIAMLVKSGETEEVEEERTPSGRLKRKCNYTNKVEKPKKKFEIRLTLSNLVIHCRKICDHPYLVQNPLDTETNYHEISEKIVEDSGKLQVMDCLLKGLKIRGHKVLIFSIWVRMLDILHDYCDLRGYNVCRLDGNMGLEERCEQISAFNTNPDSFVFLISTKAGGLGLNLMAADTVILYESDWNPQVDLQAQDRCHRIGQTKPVVVYRLMTSHSVEEHVFARAGAKRKLEKVILKTGRFSGEGMNKNLRETTIEELKELLMSTDHQKTVESRSGMYSNEELAALLDRSDMMSQNSFKASCEVLD